MLDLNETPIVELDGMMTTMNVQQASDEKVSEEGDMVDSGTTTNSSVLNAEGTSSNCGDEDSCSTHNFDILKKDDLSLRVNNDDTETGPGMIVTKQFFPMSDRGGGCLKPRLGFGFSMLPSQLSMGSSSSSQQRPHWVDLSSPIEVATVPNVLQLQPQAQLQLQPQVQTQVKKSRRGPRSRSSQYRGVTFYRRTGRWESHIWDCGKQVYLGGFDTAHAAARAYDRAAIKFRGVEADINFALNDYDDDLKQMKNLSKEEFVHILRRHSTGFSRGSSKFRGVTLHKCSQWEARMGQFLGKKAYDKAATQCNGREAVTNFEASTYEGEIVPRAAVGGTAHNLNLNLGMSPPPTPNTRRESNIAGDFHLNASHYNVLGANKAMMDQPAMLTVGGHPPQLTMATDHHSSLAGFYPSSFPNRQENATEKRIQIGASAGFSNWAWQHGQSDNTAPMQLFSAAASSGFSSSITSASSAAPNTNISHYHHPYRPLPSATSTTSQYYYHRN